MPESNCISWRWPPRYKLGGSIEFGFSSKYLPISFFNTSIMIPGGKIFARGKDVIKKRDADSNTARKEN